MAHTLSIPHSQQNADGYCLPACTQMALAHLGILRSQAELGRILKIRPGFGVPAPNIVNLRSRQLTVIYQIAGSIDTLYEWLDKDIPVIVCVQAGELPHWRGVRAQHAVLVVGVDGQNIYLHDPAVAYGPLPVPIDDFLLAWDEMDGRYAVLFKSI